MPIKKRITDKTIIKKPAVAALKSSFDISEFSFSIFCVFCDIGYFLDIL